MKFPTLSVVNIITRDGEKHSYIIDNFLVTPVFDGFEIEYQAKGKDIKLDNVKEFSVRLFSSYEIEGELK